MKSCSQCASFDRCNALVGAAPTWNECDWVPSRFILNTNWVSCEDRLPNQYERVIVIYDTPCLEDLIDICHLDRGLWWLNANHALDRRYEIPKFWLPLADLPTDTEALVLTEQESIP